MAFDTTTTPPMGGLRLRSGDVTPGDRSTRTLRQANALVACGFNLKKKRVLNLGCAEGLHSLYMAQNAQEIIGIDHRQSKIDLARANAATIGITNVDFRCGDIRDPEIFASLGRFDLVIAWGFLHRVTDIFSLLYSLEPLADALSFEWRTPVFPMMSKISVAYHAPVGKALDPTNVSSRPRVPGEKIVDSEKIEGSTGFWEPTPGAVATILSRLGYKHHRVLGYGEGLVSEQEIVSKVWTKHLEASWIGPRGVKLPRARVHMICEKVEDSIEIESGWEKVKFPPWDIALQEHSRRHRAE